MQAYKVMGVRVKCLFPDAVEFIVQTLNYHNIQDLRLLTCDRVHKKLLGDGIVEFRGCFVEEWWQEVVFRSILNFQEKCSCKNNGGLEERLVVRIVCRGWWQRQWGQR